MPMTFWIQIHNFLQPIFAFWWMSCTVPSAFEPNEAQAGVGYTYAALPSDPRNAWAVKPCAGLSWPNREQWVLPYPASGKDSEPAEISCTPQSLPCPATACAGRVQSSLVRLTCAAVVPLCHPPGDGIGSAYTWLCCTAVCLKSYPSFH